MVNSGILDGMSVEDAKKAIIEYLEKESIGHAKVNYKLRDWVFSRQRYWGEPIPIIICDKCGYVPLDESELPLTLPNVESYETTDTGESPLSKIDEWVNVKCPHCGGPAKRETDTMPQWAGSSWYYLRYCDPHNDKELASREALEKWMPVDWYNGGMEHTTLHLLYSRFWHKFLYDIGVVTTLEPYKKRTSHGMILGENGEKMSKSRGNTVDPNDIVRQYGADTLRLYIMFIGDFEKAVSWNSESIKGCNRFLDKIWNLADKVVDGGISSDLEADFHRTIKKVTNDIESLKFNTAVAALMTLVNKILDNGSITKKEFEILLILLNPFAPHMTEELYETVIGGGYLHDCKWPEYDEAKCVEDSVEIAIQVNGKLKSRITLPVDMPESEALAAAKSDEKISAAIAGMAIVKEIYVKNKLINIVVKKG